MKCFFKFKFQAEDDSINKLYCRVLLPTVLGGTCNTLSRTSS